MSIPDVLAELNQAALADMAVRKEQISLKDLEKMIEERPPALDPLPVFASPGISILSEVKRQSPSKGPLAEISDPAELATQYQQGGAAAISVLTQRHRFGGSLEDLDAVREAVTIPVLRKDFIVDEYLLFEARAHGADLALLIVASLSDSKLESLYNLALELGLTPLVEVHTEEETKRAVDLGAKLIGVNNRNLKTLEVDLRQFERLVDLIPDDVVRVAESGLRGPADVADAYAKGADVVLIGETLVRNGNPKLAIQQMMASAGTYRERDFNREGRNEHNRVDEARNAG